MPTYRVPHDPLLFRWKLEVQRHFKFRICLTRALTPPHRARQLQGLQLRGHSFLSSPWVADSHTRTARSTATDASTTWRDTTHNRTTTSKQENMRHDVTLTQRRSASSPWASCTTVTRTTEPQRRAVVAERKQRVHDTKCASKGAALRLSILTVATVWVRKGRPRASPTTASTYSC